VQHAVYTLTQLGKNRQYRWYIFDCAATTCGLGKKDLKAQASTEVLIDIVSLLLYQNLRRSGGMHKLKSLVLLFGGALLGLTLLVSFRIFPETAVSQKQFAGNAPVPVHPRDVAAVDSNSTWQLIEGIIF